MTKLTVGICGNLSPDTPEHLNPLPLLNDADVQDVIMEVNRCPQPLEEVVDSYSQQAENLKRLLSLDVLREEDGRTYVNFTLFDSEDQKVVQEVADKHAQDLAECFRGKRDVFRDIMSTYRNPEISFCELSYSLLGCYFLDLLALHLAKEWDNMNFAKPQPGDNHYTLWAEERGDLNLREVYWGCHSLQAGDYVLQTFGDHHHETRREALPDILYNEPNVSFAGSDTYKSLLFETRRELGIYMGGMLDYAVEQSVSKEALCQQVDIAYNRAEKMVNLLCSLGYLSGDEDSLRTAVPFFSSPDLDLIKQVFHVCIPIFHDWCSHSVFRIEKDLSAVKPIQNGVSFDEVLIQVWHHIFGLTNKYLSRQGMILDTYGSESRYKGYLPMVIEKESMDCLVQEIPAWAEKFK